MRINNNLAALNAWRNLSVNSDNMQKSLERLSSGYRINKAADDAAGLAVSEKMKAQIRGLSMAERNTQDGISLLQTAEGGASQIQDMLQRMRELAVQSASQSLEDADRAQLQLEFEELAKEINRTAKTTTFNNQALITGEKDTTASFIGIANQGYSIQVERNAASASAGETGEDGDGEEQDQGGTQTGDNGTDPDGLLSLTASTTTDDPTKELTAGMYKLTINNGSASLVNNAASETINFSVIYNSETGRTTLTSSDYDVTITVTGYDGTSNGVVVGAVAITHDKSYKIQVGANEGQSVTFGITALNGQALGITKNDSSDTLCLVDNIRIDTAENASRTITTLDRALSVVTSARAKMGAYQNRLETTVDTLETQYENLTAAESRIRDVDMAQEMANFTKYQILQQASTAMLAQANQLPQSILSLLQ